MMLETNDLHQSRVIKKDVKNVHECEHVLIVAFDRQRLSFVGFPSMRSVHSDCLVNAVIFSTGNRVSLHFERRQHTSIDQPCFNKVYISYSCDDRNNNVHSAMNEVNAMFARLMEVAATLKLRESNILAAADIPILDK